MKDFAVMLGLVLVGLVIGKQIGVLLKNQGVQIVA